MIDIQIVATVALEGRTSGAQRAAMNAVISAQDWNTMKIKKYAPENSIVFISDNLQSEPPEHIWGNMINYNATCVSVGCYPEIDGETEFHFGRAEEVSTEFEMVFDGNIETPNRTLIISTVEETILLEDTVPALETRLRVWLSHPRWPETVVIGWG